MVTISSPLSPVSLSLRFIVTLAVLSSYGPSSCSELRSVCIPIMLQFVIRQIINHVYLIEPTPQMKIVNGNWRDRDWNLHSLIYCTYELTAWSRGFLIRANRQ
jgi:hypothetical protein